MSLTRSRARVAAAVAAALLAGGVTTWATAPSGQSPDPAPTLTSTALSDPTADGLASPATPAPSQDQADALRSGDRERTLPQVTARDARPGSTSSRSLPRPSRLVIDELDLSMAIRPVGVARDGQMALPSTPALMGWYEHGPRPGDAQGATVLAAHRDLPDHGTGPAARLERLRRGDVLSVRSGGSTRRYRVTQVTQLTKQTLDLDALFARTGPPRVHLVTCSGRFDPETRSYEKNLVVVAVPVA